jgi:hypothetical protein
VADERNTCRNVSFCRIEKNQHQDFWDDENEETHEWLKKCLNNVLPNVLRYGMMFIPMPQGGYAKLAGQDKYVISRKIQETSINERIFGDENEESRAYTVASFWAASYI